MNIRYIRREIGWWILTAVKAVNFRERPILSFVVGEATVILAIGIVSHCCK